VKLKLIGAVLLLVSITAMPNLVEGANSQGFEWAIEEGSRFDYTYDLSVTRTTTTAETTTRTSTMYERCYVVVNSLPSIPDVVTTTAQVWFSSYDDVSIYWANGSDVYPRYIEWAAVPIGNWPLFTSMAQSQVEDPEYNTTYEITNAPNTWILVQEDVDEISQVSWRWEISKTDGVLTRFWKRANVTGMWDSILEITRVGPIPEMAVYVAVGGVAVLLVVAVIAMKRRR